MDKLLHFFVGFALTAVLIQTRLHKVGIFLLILFIATTKEFVDFHFLAGSTLTESFLDILATILPALLIGREKEEK